MKKSAVGPDMVVKIPGSDEEVELAQISKTGGLLNAFEAAKVAAALESQKKGKQDTKSTLKKIKKDNTYTPHPTGGIHRSGEIKPKQLICTT